MSELQAYCVAPAMPGAGANPERPWSLRLLGATELRAAAASAPLRPTGPALLLLARLALWPDRSHPREELVELLWPGVVHDVGRNRLRQALAVLRSLLDGARGAALLQADRHSIRLVAGALRCDVRDFEDALRRGELPAARALYRGDLLPGCYDEWVADERRRLAALADRLETTAPVPVAAEPVADPLPSYWTRPFGVEPQRDRLAAQVLRERLVTLHGPGGSGKTRLAVVTAQALRERSSGAGGAGFERIVFVSLIDCVDARQTLAAMTDALRAQGEGPALRRIVAALGGRRSLLVLDNVEQIDEGAAATLPRLLAALPELHLLATSRRLLQLDGEHAFEHVGLPLPQPDVSPALAAGNAAVALFADRAAAVRSGFVLGGDTLAAVVELVRLLGGMPLALELAASRLRTLSAAELLARLTSAEGTPMLDLLARPAARASVDARHASLRHVMAWSWRQLDAAQRQMLEWLSVFGAAASSAAIAAAANDGPSHTERLLADLHDASLTCTSIGLDGCTHHALLQPVREFASKQLAPGAARDARRRLRRWLIDVCPLRIVHGPAALAGEMPHVHAAITSAVGDDDAAAAIELALVLRDHWETDALPLPDIIALEQALDVASSRPGIGAAMRADAHELLAYARIAAGGADAAATHAERALALATDPGRRSRALVRWATTMYQAGRFDAEVDPALNEALELARGIGDVVAQASSLRVMAILRSNLKLDFAGAEALMAQAQALWERIGNQPMVRIALLSRAVMWVWLGRIEEGLAVHHECERSAAASGDWLGLIHVTRQLGRALIRARRPADAVEALRRSLCTAWQRGHAQGVAHALLHIGDALAMSPDRALQERAARLHGFADLHWQRTFGRLNPIEAHELRRTQRLLRLRLRAPLAETLRLQGASMRLDEAVALGASDAAARAQRGVGA